VRQQGWFRQALKDQKDQGQTDDVERTRRSLITDATSVHRAQADDFLLLSGLNSALAVPWP
jgi:hypothetical protein